MSQEIFELLRADNTIYANRTLAAAIGLNEAVIFSTLLSKEHYYKSNGQLDGEGMFYSTASDLEERTALTQRQQDRAVTHLEELGLICTKLKGMPARKYFRINPDTEMLLKLLREKPKKKDIKKADIPVKKDSNDTGTDGGSDSVNSGNEQPENNDENKGEASFDKMLKQGSAEAQTLFQQNVKTSMDKTLKQDSTKSESMVQQNRETIFNINNNKNIYNKNNSAHARDEPDKNIDADKLNHNFMNLINNFTDNESLRTAIAEYIKMRLKRPKTVTTDYAVKLVLQRLTELSPDPDMQIKILNQSILNSYPDLYVLRKSGGESNDFNGKSADNRGTGKTHPDGLADGRPIFSGVVKLGRKAN